VRQDKSLRPVEVRRRARRKTAGGEKAAAANHDPITSQRVIEFPTPPEAVVSDTIIFEIGGDRFAMTWKTERLPPAGPVAVERKQWLNPRRLPVW
jgi:hypothetical protein